MEDDHGANSRRVTSKFGVFVSVVQGFDLERVPLAACSLTSLLLTNDRYDISAFTSQSSNVQHHLIVPAASTLLEQHILAEELRSRWISFKHRMVAENLRRFCRHWDTNQYPKQTRAECICENK